jgi:CxxC motif-containing protein
MKELVCIVCPKGCRLHVDDEHGYTVTGNSCPRGAAYGKNEIQNPTRVVTSTVRLAGGLYRRCPVKTDAAVPKGKIMDVMKQLNGVDLRSPVAIGQVVLPNVAGTGANVVVTKNL